MILETVEKSINDQLKRDADVMRITSARVAFGLKPQFDTDPSINFFRVGGSNYVTLMGRICLNKAVFQISNWGRNASEANELRLYSKRALCLSPFGCVQSSAPINEHDEYNDTTREYQAIVEMELVFNDPL